MKDLKFEELVANFISDSEYQYVFDFEKNFNFFDVCQIQREGSSAFLGWLLNPSEGHGMEGRLIKEFLLANFETFEKYINDQDERWTHRAGRLKDSNFFKEITKYEIANTEFKNVSVFPSVEFTEGTPSLVVLIHDLKAAVVIENRYHDDEAERTVDYGMIGSLPSDYRTLYSYIDRELTTETEKRINTNWVCLDYSWFEGFLENTIGRGLYNSHVEPMVRDFYIHLSGDEAENMIFERKLQAFENIYRSHEELIFYLKEYRFEGRKLSELNNSERFFARAKTNSKEIEFYLKHETILTELLTFAEFAWIRCDINEKIGTEFDVEITVGNDYISLYNKSWSKYLSSWPFSLGTGSFLL